MAVVHCAGPLQLRLDNSVLLELQWHDIVQILGRGVGPLARESIRQPVGVACGTQAPQHRAWEVRHAGMIVAVSHGGPGTSWSALAAENGGKRHAGDSATAVYPLWSICSDGCCLVPVPWRPIAASAGAVLHPAGPGRLAMA